MLIVCALIVSGLSSRTRVVLTRTELDWLPGQMGIDIGRAGNAISKCDLTFAHV